MDWKELPYDHSGTWEKKFDSIMSPATKVTWPQFIVEMVIYWRSRILKDYPKITKGQGWSRPIATQVRNLEHQAATICNYFPHPDKEPLVIYAIKKYFRENKPLRLGGFRKNRTTVNKDTGRESSTVTQAEKDIVNGIQAELDKVLKTRNLYVETKPLETRAPHEIRFETTRKTTKKNSLAFALALEKQVKSDTPKTE